SHDSAFQGSDAPLQHRGCRIANAAVSISFNFKIEESGTVIGAVECISDGLINWYRDGLCRRLDLVSAMDGNRFRSHALTRPRSQISLQYANSGGQRPKGTCVHKHISQAATSLKPDIARLDTLE